jgi:hypothetical protein
MDQEHQAQQEKELSWGKETVLSHVLLILVLIREHKSPI